VSASRVLKRASLINDKRIELDTFSGSNSDVFLINTNVFMPMPDITTHDKFAKRGNL